MRAPGLVLLLDDRLPGAVHWIATGLDQRGYHVTLLDIPSYSLRNRLVRWRKVILWWQYLELAVRGLRLARQNDAIILSTNFHVGALAAAMGRLHLGDRPNVLALNAIVREKGLVLTWARSQLYRLASGGGGLRLTVNSQQNALRYQRMFGFDEQHVSVVNDPWEPEYPAEDRSDVESDSIFCGGEAARDWDTFFAVARDHPDISFVGVARSKDWAHGHQFPENVHMRFDIPESDFYDCVGKARIVVLPLKSSVTAGLIVLVRSALVGRLVLATKTPATESYYPTDRHDLLVAPGDAGAFSALVDRYWDDAHARRAAAKDVKAHILAHRSPDKYLDAIAAILGAVPGCAER
jgi:hypothetical protein